MNNKTEDVKEAIKRVAIKRSKTLGIKNARERLFKTLKKETWKNCPEIIEFIEQLLKLLNDISDCNLLEKFSEENSDRIRTLIQRGKIFGNTKEEIKEIQCRKQTQLETNLFINEELFKIEMNKYYFEGLAELVY